MSAKPPPHPALPFTVERMISEIESHDAPKTQAQSLIALAALSMRVKLDESFLRVVKPIVDVLEKKTTTNNAGDDDDDDDDDFEGVTAAAFAALSCFLGNVERAHEEMLREEKRGVKVVVKAIEKAMEERKRVNTVNGLDCLAWTCRDKECASFAMALEEGGKKIVEEARKMCELEYVKERYFGESSASGSKNNSEANNSSKNDGKEEEEKEGEKEEETKRLHFRRQEDAVQPKQIAAGAFELFLALSVSEAEKITTEHDGLQVFASAIKRVGCGDNGAAAAAVAADVFTKDEEAKILAHFKSEGHPNPAEELERLRQHETNEVASRALVGISCCCKFPGTALKLCSDEIAVRKIATLMTSSDPNVKQQALALFTAIARAPECKPLVEKALRGARDVASV
jgi:hypothetical protein